MTLNQKISPARFAGNEIRQQTPERTKDEIGVGEFISGMLCPKSIYLSSTGL